MNIFSPAAARQLLREIGDSRAVPLRLTLKLAVTLTAHGHVWTDEERADLEWAISQSPYRDVSLFHDVAADDEYCDQCDNGGWVQCYSERPPAFEECPACSNPNDLPSP